ncbi:MAG: hypothetical protein AAF790_12250 [Planctomycetota bacterium]
MAVKINFDVTGFYFGRDIDVEKTDSIRDVCNKVMYESKGEDAEFSFKPEVEKPQFLGEITVVHRVQARSRQNSGRVYNPGIYRWNDAVDNNNRNPALLWQYYVFDKDNRLLSGVQEYPQKRMIVPFTKPAAERGFLGRSTGEFMTDDRIVWRLVGILGGPNVGGPKGTA